MSKLWESPPKQDKFGIVVAQWFIECIPHLHPYWNHYLVACHSLKNVKGLSPAKLHFPEATHEFFVIALNRDYKPTYDNPDSFHFLTPLNYVKQFTATDKEAKEIAYQAALMLQRSQMLLETSGLFGARALNDQLFEALVRREVS